jgi:hypothetical protein
MRLLIQSNIAGYDELQGDLYEISCVGNSSEGARTSHRDDGG